MKNKKLVAFVASAVVLVVVIIGLILAFSSRSGVRAVPADVSRVAEIVEEANHRAYLKEPAQTASSDSFAEDLKIAGVAELYLNEQFAAMRMAEESDAPKVDKVTVKTVSIKPDSANSNMYTLELETTRHLVPANTNQKQLLKYEVTLNDDGKLKSVFVYEKDSSGK